jgi:hypothetical protein
MSRTRLVGYACSVFVGSWLLVMLCTVFAMAVLPAHEAARTRRGFVMRMAELGDGEWYRSIVTQGYVYDNLHMSSIVFFPGYPLLARWVIRWGRLPVDLGMLLTANVLMLGAFVVMALYLCDRIGEPHGEAARRWALLALGFAPASFFFHLAYTESMLLLLMALALYGMHHRWPPLGLAMLIGAATAVRSTGILLGVPFAMYLWKWAGRRRGTAEAPLATSMQSAIADPAPTVDAVPLSTRISRMALMSIPLALIGCWGLLAFLAFQQRQFGTPLAFAKAQLVWRVRETHPTSIQRVVNLLTLESVRHAYLRGNPLYWNRFSPHGVPVLSFLFVNPLFFLATGVLLLLGIYQGWLDRLEASLGLTMWLFTYVVQAERQGMYSQARFTAAILPVYLVLGQLLARVPRRMAIALMMLSGALFACYAALFTAGYPMY